MSEQANAELDQIDQRLIDLLVLDGRTPNRMLAQDVGMTDSAVASRIRRLVNSGVIQVCPQFDWEAIGYRCTAISYLRLAGASSDSFSTLLTELSGVLSVELTYGSADLVAMLIAPDLAEMHGLISRISTLPSVTSISTNLVVDVLAWSNTMGILPLQPISLESFPAPPIDLDDLDQMVIDNLVEDGRQSSQEIARQTGVSNSTIGSRRRRMEEAGILRVRALMDPFTTGRFGSPAHVGLSVKGDASLAVKRLLELPPVALCMTSIGTHNIVASIAAGTAEELSQILTEVVPAVPGVERLDVWPVIRVAFHRSNLTRFV